MDARGWDELDILIVNGDAYVDHPAFGPVADRALPRGRAASASASSRSPTGRAPSRSARMGAPRLFFGVTAGQPRLDAQPAHGAEEDPREDQYSPGRPHRLPPEPRHASSTRNLCRAGVSRRADRARRHRGLAAAHRALRLLVATGAPLDPARRQGRSARLRHGRAAGLGGRAIGCAAGERDRATSATCAAPRSSINNGRDGSATRPIPRARAPTARSSCCRRYEEVVGRQARVRARCRARFQLETNPGNARPLLQRARRRGGLLQPAGVPARDGAGTRRSMDELYDLPFTRVAALRSYARARSPRYETVKHSIVTHARLLRRLHVLLDHRARGPRDPEPLGGERAARGARAAPHGRLPRHDHRPRRPHREHVPDACKDDGDRDARAGACRACIPASART